jgi:hypothetical protein
VQEVVEEGNLGRFVGGTGRDSTANDGAGNDFDPDSRLGAWIDYFCQTKVSTAENFARHEERCALTES